MFQAAPRSALVSPQYQKKTSPRLDTVCGTPTKVVAAVAAAAPAATMESFDMAGMASHANSSAQQEVSASTLPLTVFQVTMTQANDMFYDKSLKSEHRRPMPFEVYALSTMPAKSEASSTSLKNHGYGSVQTVCKYVQVIDIQGRSCAIHVEQLRRGSQSFSRHRESPGQKNARAEQDCRKHWGTPQANLWPQEVGLPHLLHVQI